MASDPIARFRALPKAEIHVHLEGSIDTDEIVQLAAAAGEALPRPPAEFLRFKDLADFLGFLDWYCGLVRTQEQMTQVAYRFSRRIATAGTRYADAIINPMHWQAWRRAVPVPVRPRNPVMVGRGTGDDFVVDTQRSQHRREEGGFTDAR